MGRMEIKFDRNVVCGGLDASVTIENGKARVEFTIFLSLKDAVERKPEDWRVEIRMYDQEGQEVAGMRVPVEAVESLSTHTLIIYPHLWKGVEEPYLYKVRGSLVYQNEVRDALERVLPICNLENIPGKGWYLNGRPFELKAVRYRMPEGEGVADVEVLRKELKMVRDLGANCVLPDGFEGEMVFREMCMTTGLVVWDGEADDAPLFCGDDSALLELDRERKSDVFYYYKACWGKDKVLYICLPVRRDGSGESVVKVYSNQKKVALYVDGRLQEFKESAPVFLFEDVPVQWGETVISAQAGECFYSVTV